MPGKKAKKPKKAEKLEKSNELHVDYEDKKIVSLANNLNLNTNEHYNREGEKEPPSRIVFDSKLQRFTEEDYKEALNFYKLLVPGGKFDNPKGHVDKILTFLVEKLYSTEEKSGQSLHGQIMEAFEKLLRDTTIGPNVHYHTLPKLLSVMSATCTPSANYRAGILLLHIATEIRKLSKSMFHQDKSLHEKKEEEIEKIMDERLEKKFGKELYHTAIAFMDWAFCFSPHNPSAIQFLMFCPENPIKVFGSKPFQQRTMLSVIATARLFNNSDLCVEATSSE